MPLFQIIVVFPCSCYTDLLLPQLTTVDANQSESKEVLKPDCFITSDCMISSVTRICLTLLQTVELTAEKLDMLIERLTQLQQALHSVV